MYELILSDNDFIRLSDLIQSTWGIKMPSAKKGMLQGRLVKRLRQLGMSSLDEYCRYLFSPEGQQNELVHVIDVVSTNKTDFFREPDSFDHLVNVGLPDVIANRGAGINNKLMIWSAGCATGQEPYTLAMFLAEFQKNLPGLQLEYQILATDISITALEKAKRAIYPHELVAPIPTAFRQQYLLRSKNREDDRIRIRPELRSKVRFRQINLMEPFELREYMDIIFCRNVIIYFDRPTQEKLFLRFSEQLSPKGYIYIGHSETLHGMNLPLQQVAPTIYRKITPEQ